MSSDEVRDRLGGERMVGHFYDLRFRRAQELRLAPKAHACSAGASTSNNVGASATTCAGPSETTSKAARQSLPKGSAEERLYRPHRIARATTMSCAASRTTSE
jgi:hypothetical protein